MNTTRAEHLAWCKQRALAYVERGALLDAWASMGSDLQRHPDTANHPAIMAGTGLLLIGDLNTPDKMRKFIEGFN